MTSGERVELELPGPEDTHRLGRLLGERCRGGERLALRGELGAGKTALARGLAEGLGFDPALVSSPTFTLIQEHRDGRDGLGLVHADLYRMDSTEELEALGWEELRADSRLVLAVEWPDRVPEALPEPELVVGLEHVSDAGGRRAVLHAGEAGGHLVSGLGATGPTEPCRRCGAPAPVGAAHAPFCSDRCRLADLGNWFDGRYAISRDIEEDDLFDPDLT